jgi:hypothetical protein
LEDRVLQEFGIIVESDVEGMTGINEGLIRKRGQDALDRRVKIQTEDHGKGWKNKPVPETFAAQTLPKLE